jgi:hypothetical protein
VQRQLNRTDITLLPEAPQPSHTLTVIPLSPSTPRPAHAGSKHLTIQQEIAKERHWPMLSIHVREAIEVRFPEVFKEIKVTMR